MCAITFPHEIYGSCLSFLGHICRRRYVAMQTNMAPITIGSIETPNQLKQDFTNTTNITPMSNTLVHTPKFVSPSSSSTSPLDNPHVAAKDTVTSVVSMLKDTLERKKLGSHANKDTSTGILIWDGGSTL
jgi:hypothetical protein